VRSSARSSWFGALALAILAGGSTAAHRRDEYLQAALLAIDPDRVQLTLDLTPGIAVAESVLAEIDLDGNRSISAAEGRAYAGRLLSAVAVDVDGTPLGLAVVGSTVPEVDAVLKGEATMRVNMEAALPRLGAGVHHLRYRNSHRPDIAAYLANALVPASERVTIARQQRDVAQQVLTVEYLLRADRGTRALSGLTVGIAGVLIWLAMMWYRSRHPPRNSP
jgi:hypothetical protein